MPNFCSIVVCGHLGRDANLKDVNGQSVLEFSVAYNAKKDDPPKRLTRLEQLRQEQADREKQGQPEPKKDEKKP